MDKISTYSSALIKKIIQVEEISYYELRKMFEDSITYPNLREFKEFNFNNELDKLEDMGIIKIKEGMIHFEGM